MTKVIDLSATTGGSVFVNPKQVAWLRPTGSIEGHVTLWRLGFSDQTVIIVSQEDMLKLWPHLRKQLTAPAHA